MNQRKEERALIVSHFDLDGIFSAILIILQLIEREGKKFNDFVVRLIAPYMVKVLKCESKFGPYQRIYLADLAPDPNAFQQWKEWIMKNLWRIEKWYDHHLGWERSGFTQTHPSQFIIDSSAKCCAQIISGDPALVEMAIRSDTRYEFLPKDFRGLNMQHLDGCLRVKFGHEKTAFAVMLGILIALGVKIPDQIAAQYQELLRQKKKEYLPLFERTVQTGKGYTLSMEGIDRVQAEVPVDITLLSCLGHSSAIVKVMQAPNSNGKTDLYVTSRKVNLLELFQREIGSPFRVRFKAEELGEVLQTLKVRLPKECA